MRPDWPRRDGAPGSGDAPPCARLLARLGLTPASCRPTTGGARLAAGVAGSITHKEGLAAALVALESRARVGVDLELDVVRTLDIASRVLTTGELAGIAPLDAIERAREVLLRFSAKEAVYKALDPFVRRYVGFRRSRVSAARRRHGARGAVAAGGGGSVPDRRPLASVRRDRADDGADRAVGEMRTHWNQKSQ